MKSDLKIDFSKRKWRILLFLLIAIFLPVAIYWVIYENSSSYGKHRMELIDFRILYYPALFFGFCRTFYLKVFSRKKLIFEWVIAGIINFIAVLMFGYWLVGVPNTFETFIFAIFLVGLLTAPILTIHVVLLYIFIIEEATEIGAGAAPKVVSKIPKAISGQRVFRFENFGYLFLLWIMAGPLNPNLLIFYYGYETSFVFEDTRPESLIGFVSIPSAIWCAIVIYFLKRKRQFGKIKVIGIMLISLLITLLIYPPLFFAVVISIQEKTFDFLGILAVLAAVFMLGWSFLITPIAGFNLAKYTMLFAMIILWFGTKSASKIDQ